MNLPHVVARWKAPFGNVEPFSLNVSSNVDAPGRERLSFPSGLFGVNRMPFSKL